MYGEHPGETPELPLDPEVMPLEPFPELLERPELPDDPLEPELDASSVDLPPQATASVGTEAPATRIERRRT